MVEAAIVTPLMLLLVFGIIEFGFLYKDSLTVTNGSRAGARVATAQGVDPLADYNMLKAVQGATGSLAHVQKIIVFKASSSSGTVPSGCLTAAIAGSCNVYDASDLTISQSAFQAAGYTKDDSWASSSRVTSVSSTTGPDYLGVYVEARHTSVLHLIIADRNLSDTTVMRMEPTR